MFAVFVFLFLCTYCYSDYKPVARHDEFRLFACMNPATDVGKKTLPYSIRNRYNMSP